MTDLVSIWLSLADEECWLRASSIWMTAVDSFGNRERQLEHPPLVSPHVVVIGEVSKVVHINKLSFPLRWELVFQFESSLEGVDPDTVFAHWIIYDESLVVHVVFPAYFALPSRWSRRWRGRGR